MILINLLPHREATRQRQKRRFFMQLAAVVLLGLVLSALVFRIHQQSLDAQQVRNESLRQAITRLDQDISALGELEKNRAVWQMRLNTVEQLLADRSLPMHLMQELVLQIPDGVGLGSLKQEGSSVVLTGTATSQEQVATLLHNLGSSDWLSQPELVEMVGTSTNSATISATSATRHLPETPRTASFTVRVHLGPSVAAADHARPFAGR